MKGIVASSALLSFVACLAFISRAQAFVATPRRGLQALRPVAPARQVLTRSRRLTATASLDTLLSQSTGLLLAETKLVAATEVGSVLEDRGM